MSRKTSQTENLTRYLLGEMPEAERARLEDALLGDEALFQQVAEAEHDLLDDYVGDRLGRSERERFEQHYLQLPGSRERLQTARLIARERIAREVAPAVVAAPTPAITEPERASLLDSLRAFWRGSFPSLTPYALGLAVLALVVGGIWWAVARRAAESPQVAKVIPEATPFPDRNGTQTSATPQPDSNQNATTPEPTPRPQPKPSTTPVQPREGQRSVVLALVAGLTRGDGAANALVVPKGTDMVRLEFGLGNGTYRDVRASLRTVEGREVWGGTVQAPRAGRKAAVSLPARLFSNEDYLLILSGTDASGERVEFQEFYFNARVQ